MWPVHYITDKGQFWLFGIGLFCLNLYEKGSIDAIINSAKIGMILKLPMLLELNQMFWKRSRVVLYRSQMLQGRFLCLIYQVLCCNWRSRDPKDVLKDLEQAHNLFLDLISPLYPWGAQFISQIVKIAHKIRNYVYITSILSLHYLISFCAILTYHIWSSIRGLSEVMSSKILVHHLSFW